MKKILLLFAVLFSISSFSQDLNYKEYSYSDLFKMIEEEKDSVFILENAIITLNEETDKDHIVLMDTKTLTQSYYRKDTIVINKEIQFNNVQFGPFDRLTKQAFINDALHHIRFKKRVGIFNTANIPFQNCVFENSVVLTGDKQLINIIPALHQRPEDKMNNSLLKTQIRFNEVIFEENLICQFYTSQDEKIDLSIYVFDSKLNVKSIEKNSNIVGFGIKGIYVENSIINSYIDLGAYQVDNISISNITFKKPARIEINNSKSLEFENNTFNSFVGLDIDEFPVNSSISWEQLSNKLINSESYRLDYIYRRDVLKTQPQIDGNWLQEDLASRYIEESSFKRKPSYINEIKLRSKFLSYFKNIYDLESANKVYIDLKNLETKRLAFVYEENPNFKSFFTWKINQFLKVFSAYGTEPARAVIFSVYVILLFAFIYLLFPNSWDSHGRKRIMNRYAFFFTYMNKKAGIHEVYLDNQKENLLEFDEFKTLVDKQGKSVPKFFTATALPLYKWAISGTKFSSGILRRVDIMKGTWNDLPKSKRIWKSFLLIGAFLIAICYDIFIKMLNALMLSINTFTTLCFWRNTYKRFAKIFSYYTRFYWLVYVNYLFCFTYFSIVKLNRNQIL
jgi:hypothetical protein